MKINNTIRVRNAKINGKNVKIKLNKRVINNFPFRGHGLKIPKKAAKTEVRLSFAARKSLGIPKCKKWQSLEIVFPKIKDYQKKYHKKLYNFDLFNLVDDENRASKIGLIAFWVGNVISTISLLAIVLGKPNIFIFAGIGLSLGAHNADKQCQTAQNFYNFILALNNKRTLNFD